MTIRANAVEIRRPLGTRYQQAYCRIPDCGWIGDTHDTYQEANTERQQHLEEHRRAAE